MIDFEFIDYSKLSIFSDSDIDICSKDKHDLICFLFLIL